MPAFGKVATEALAARSLLSGLGKTVKNATSGIGGVVSDVTGDLTGLGVSTLGTTEAKLLPDFLTNNPLTDGTPWGQRDAKNTDYYDMDAIPNTGVTRNYDWTVSSQPCAPDGVTIDCVLVNGQFPGPLVEANWGDWIEVKVKNNLTELEEGTAIHWHGFLQKNTQYMDGVPGYDQCPIAPEGEFTYRFRASLYGSSWYHSHYSAQYGSGMVGPMVVYGPKNADYDVDIGPVMVMDWYHQNYKEAVEGLFKPIPNAIVPRADSNTINGKGTYGDLETPIIPTFNFTSGKTHRLRLINPSSVAVQKITIDNHKFKVIANDFVEIQPYTTDVITLGVGQRSDVIVEATGDSTDAIYLRAYRPADCALSNGNEEVKATIYYEDADRSELPVSSAGSSAYDNDCHNDDLSKTQPMYEMKAEDASVTEILPIELKSNGTHLVWYQANRTFRINYNDPILLRANEGERDYPEIENVHNYGTNKTLRFIIENPGNQYHPMHMHGHNIQVLAEGPCSNNNTVFGGNQTDSLTNNVNGFSKRNIGDSEWPGEAGETMGNYGSCWDGTIVNPDNPQRRDVQNVAPGSFIVLQWKQDNPGVWPLHCHIAWHLSSGFVWTVLENPDALENEMKIPDIMSQTCRDWDAWSNRNVVDQIDDGL